MEIKVLGTGCAKCNKLEATVVEVMKELGKEVPVDHVKDMKKMMEYPILATPALVINEEVVCSGRVPTKQEVTSWITTALAKES